jgi:hypothetical protein
MKSLNQNKINKIFIIVLFVLVSFIMYSRITEQKRVEYYICYEQVASMTSNPDEEAIRDYCKERID